jgi:transketolase
MRQRFKKMPTTRELANAIRMLSIEAIQKANSGHPGMPMGMADIATILWRDFLLFSPQNPHWFNRDRFIISNGHGSMLLYSLLHLTGYQVTIDDLKNFRQLHSKTPGHPEYGCLPGVETTTGPLGQGFSNAVGMALAEKILGAQFNRPGFPVVDHYTYVFVGDGCLMEGISHEVASLAGTHQLGKLIVFWDDNKISIDGDTHGWFTEDVAKRFEAYNWQVIRDVDGYDEKQIAEAIKTAKKDSARPTLICCKTIIGFGAPNLCNDHNCHGSPLGAKEIEATRQNLGWKYPSFEIPKEIYQAFDHREKGAKSFAEWEALFKKYQAQFPDLAKEFFRRTKRKLPETWEKTVQKLLEKIKNKPEALATRKASQNCIEAFGPILPEFLGGSADLTPSNLTDWSGSIEINKNPAGNYFHYGVREFGMCGMLNGLNLHGGFIAYAGTFLIFSDYARNALRLAAMAKIPSIFVLTHDSIGLGEDGPTHQPIEQLSSLRLIPNFSVWRPADELETALAWQFAIERTTGPTALVLSRQKVSSLPREAISLDQVKKGGYILRDCETTPECIIIASGSEVALAEKAFQSLKANGKKVRVVSMPACDVFDQQDEKYREQVLPKAVKKRIAIEAGSSAYWFKYVGLDGRVIGIDRFGESAPAELLFTDFGFSEANIVQAVQELLEKPS